MPPDHRLVQYDLPDGRRLVLVFHTKEEWADAVYLQLHRIGCSPEYCDSRWNFIMGAT